ncbi:MULTISPECIES: 4'-phosphopantetheinyl transferase superfamily protein [unclassified Acetobacterium]|uniref:4'-phosphopantetheinyl transferase family protein n=1 Tax=unclassified Acetobacterium TaxID=2638182 RepID=UPI00257E0644|nr:MULTISPECIES: 4'-phosphopantetheinyl transferase superfamily protein [unclassified Acetobacterium]
MENQKNRIFIADVRSLSKPHRLAAALRAVSTERQKKARRLKTPAAKALSVGAEILLQKAVAQSYGIDGPLVLEAGASGKPWLVDYPQICFNLSHSGDYVVCGLGSRPVGVDIQKMAQPKLRLAKRFFAPSEVDWLLTLPQEEQQQGFYDLWALKEAYMKYTGKGFNLPLHTFAIDCHREAAITAATASISEGDRISVVIKNYPELEGYVIWAVTDTGAFQECLEWITL